MKNLDVRIAAMGLLHELDRMIQTPGPDMDEAITGLKAALQTPDDFSHFHSPGNPLFVLPKCQRCHRKNHRGLRLYHPFKGARLGVDGVSFTAAPWLASCFICAGCDAVIARRLREGKIDRFLLRIRVVFIPRKG